LRRVSHYVFPVPQECPRIRSPQSSSTPRTPKNASAHTYRLRVVKDQAGNRQLQESPAKRRDYTTKPGKVNRPPCRRTHPKPSPRTPGYNTASLKPARHGAGPGHRASRRIQWQILKRYRRSRRQI
jgi:hypothetical protein